MSASTPLMRQYQRASSSRCPNALLMFRLGDFYELFFEDAVTAARELEITLTARNKEKGAGIPMCGVPYHAAEGYIARLIQKGYRVAICDQMEDPQAHQEAGAGARSRASSRPAPRRMRNLLRSHENNYLAAVARMGTRAGGGARRCFHGRVPRHRDGRGGSARRARDIWARARCCFRRPAAAAERGRAGCASCAPSSKTGSSLRLRRPHPARSLQAALARWLRAGEPAARRWARPGAILHYLRDTQRAALDHLDRPDVLRPRRFHGAGRRDGAQSGTDRAVVRGRRGSRRSHGARRARPDAAPGWAGGCCGSGCCGRR